MLVVFSLIWTEEDRPWNMFKNVFYVHPNGYKINANRTWILHIFTTTVCVYQIDSYTMQSINDIKQSTHIVMYILTKIDQWNKYIDLLDLSSEISMCLLSFNVFYWSRFAMPFVPVSFLFFIHFSFSVLFFILFCSTILPTLVMKSI